MIIKFLQIITYLLPLFWYIGCVYIIWQINKSSAVKQLLLSVFSEEPGVGSFSRVCSGLITVWELCIYSWCVHRNVPLPFSLTEAAMFASAPYGINKATGIASDVAGIIGKKKDGQ